eukprot:376693_1
MEALAISAAASFISGVGHSAAYKVAGQLVYSLEEVIAKDISHPDIRKSLIQLDVNASLATIKALLEDLTPHLGKCGATIRVCFDNLHGSVAALQKQLDIVEEKCTKHKTSYWSYMHTYPDVTEQMDKIAELKVALDHRIDLLSKSATIELQLAP